MSLLLKTFPSVNAEIEDDEIIYKNYYNISFAVGTEKGLVVPVLRDTDELSFADIEKNIKEISERARDGKLTIDDLQGGTFTISNGGVLWFDVIYTNTKFASIGSIRNAQYC